MISLLAGIIFSAVMGVVIDLFESIGDVTGGFLFIGLAMLAINIANLISLLLIKDESVDARAEMRVPMREVLRHIRENRLFVSFTLTSFLSAIASGLITGFIGVYKIGDLAFSVLTVQVINILADLFRIGVSQPLARYASRRGYARGLQLAGVMSAASMLLIVFTTPETRWLIIVYTFLQAAVAASSYQNNFNIGYTLLPQRYMTQAMALRSVVGGLISFATAILAGSLLDAVQENGNTVAGIPLYGQQLLAAVALTVKIVTLVLQHKFLVKPLDKIKGECK